MLHAAGGVDEDKTTSCLSIEEQLQRYLLSSGALDPAFLSERKGLVDQLLANPNSVEAWANLLKHEELLFASRPSNCNHKGLVHLYSSAKGLLPEEKKSTPELRGTHEFLWIGYARHTWLDNQEDGQDLFKALKTQPWASKSALFFREWAQLVHQSGDTRKALSLVQKASSQGAEPRSILEELRTQLEAGQGEQQLQVPGRKVQFQDVSTAPTVAGTSAPARRAFPCTPGANAKHDATSSTYSYTGFSGSTSSLSRTGTIGLAGDMSYTMSSSQQHNLTGNISIRSQGSCLSNDEDTSASRAADENRTQESLGGVGTMLQSRGGSGTGTITVPTGFASSLNLAAGAAAVAALGNAPTASNPVGGGGSGGNTGNVSHGLRRFGLRSGIKAVRMTRDETADGGSSGDGGPAGTQVAAAPEASIPATGGQTIRAHRIVAAVESGLKVAEIPAEQLPAQDASAAGALCDRDAAAERGAGAQAKEEVDEVLTRKRRAAEEAAQSPRFVSSVMLQEEGMKRRQSPDNVASTAAPAQPLAAATAQGAAAGSAPTTGVPVASAAGGTDLNTRIGAHLARNGYSTPALSAVSNIALRDPPLGTAPPVPNTPSTNAAVASRQPMTSAVAVLSASRAIQMREAARHTQPGTVGSTANAAADQPASVASIRPYASSRQGGACTGGGHAAPSAEPMQTDMDDQENIVPVEAGGSHGHYKEQPLDAAATVPQRVPDAREPPRPVVAHRPVLQAPTPLSAAPVATPLIAPPKPQHPASQQQLPQQHVQDVSRSDQRTHSSGQPQSQAMAFNWPDQLEQPQIRPFDGEQYVYVHGIRYQKLDVAGKGGSSKVFKVLGPNRGIYALKRVQLNNKEREAVQGFIDEITLLRQLRGKPNIIQLIDAQVFRESGLVYMVLEYGDIDLARLLYSHEEARRRAADRESSDGEGGPSSIGSSSCQEIDVNFIRLYWQQMLQAVKCIHDARIVHADLKPANFMLVQGQLKLIDFGIAKAIQGDTTSINRESQVGTLNYMSPEAIQGNGSESAYGGAPLKVGRPSDVWSLGCILYQMIYGRTPFADLQFVAKMRAICDPSYKVPIPECGEPDAVDCISRCLDRNPRTRISLQELLDHPFLHPNRHKASRPPSEGPSGASSGTASLTEEQIKAILQIARAEGNATIDPDSIARRVMQQLNGGDTGPTGSVLTSMPPPAPRNALAPPAPPPPPPPPTVSSMPRAPAPPLLAATITRAPPAPAPAAPPPPPPPGPAPPPCVGPSAPAPRPVEPLRAPPLPQAQRAATGSGGMGDIAAMAAAAAARRTAKPFAEPVPQPKAVSRPAPYAGAIPLAGAELQAAIVQQRAQLRPVQEQQHTQLSQQRQSNNGTTAKLAGMTPAPGGTATKQQRQDAESGLEVVLRRGLERFRFDDDGDDTHHDSEFMEAAMTAANRQE